MWGDLGIRGGKVLVLSTVDCPMQELLGYVDVENCRHLSCLQYCLLYNTVYSAPGEPRVLFELLSLQCNKIVSTMHCNLRAFSLLLSHNLVPIAFSLTFAFSSLSLSRYCRLEFPPSLFEQFPALFLEAFQTFLDFSPRLNSSCHVALREGLKKCDFIKTHSNVTICLEKLRF